MWTRIYPIMWVTVKVKDKRSFTLSFPVPLNLMDELIDSTLDLLDIILLFTPKAAVPKISSGEKKVYFTPEALKVLLESVHSLLHSLQNYGPYDLVDVTTNEVQVYVKIL